MLRLSTKKGRSGRGPIKLISPLSTLNIWGISSIRVVRMKEPMGVMRESFSAAQRGTPSLSASVRMERNFSSMKVLPSRPTRSCR